MIDSRHDYAQPKAGRIRLKETNDEKAQRIYRAEQDRQSRQTARINRANGHSSEGVQGSSSGGQTGRRREYGYDDVDPESLRGYNGRFRQEMLDADASMAMMEEYGYGRPDPRIPDRYRHFHQHIHNHYTFHTDIYASSSFPTSTFPSNNSHRRAEAEVHLSGGPVPGLGRMTEQEYTYWVRSGLARLQAGIDFQAQMDMRRERDIREAKREAEREKVEREAKRQRRRLDRDIADREERRVQAEVISLEKKKEGERRRYMIRWETLGDMKGDIVEMELGWMDIPWPVYSLGKGGGEVELIEGLEMLSTERIGVFLRDIARASGEEEKKVYREAIRRFHPDRFFSRVLPRVRERDREKVKEGVERCSRAINGLVADRNA